MNHRVIQTNSGDGTVFWTMLWSPATFKEELPAHRETLKEVGATSRCAWWVVPSWWVAVCTSAEIAYCAVQLGAVNTAEPLSDSYTVQAQSANDKLKNSVNKWLAWLKWEICQCLTKFLSNCVEPCLSSVLLNMIVVNQYRWTIVFFHIIEEVIM